MIKPKDFILIKDIEKIHIILRDVEDNIHYLNLESLLAVLGSPHDEEVGYRAIGLLSYSKNLTARYLIETLISATPKVYGSKVLLDVYNLLREEIHA